MMANHNLEKYRKQVAEKIETYFEACLENRTRIRILDRFEQGRYYALGEKLHICSEKEPCKSFACKKCCRELKLEQVAKLLSLYTRYKRKCVKKNERRALNGKKPRVIRPWYIITVIDYKRAFTANELPEYEDIVNIRKRMYSMLYRCGFTGPIWGAFEVDYHRLCELWLPHYHLIVFPRRRNDSCIETLKQRVKKLQPNHIKEDRKARPIMVQIVRDPIEQFSYVYKLLYSEVVDVKSQRTGVLETSKQRLEELLFAKHLFWLDSATRKSILFEFKAKGKL
ncbi:hypothetical protein [Vibrio antiquarius]|uniref:hypothetical protein n=1 Tax=Vibrio antiquarius (strain Ex25) TaxID=150340 RepID=UPI00265A18C9|nr:hypothetical protein [Vibrio antiquarius]MCR9367430.1 hypothetical protein [Vibrio antiquarius]